MGNFNVLTPFLVEKIWGGSFLSRVKALPAGNLPVGETWEVSRLAGQSSFLNNGPLEELLSEEELPYLVKFIDTSDYLSIQVHPDDDYASNHENSTGKTECWIILSAGPGAGIYLGFKEKVDPEAFKKSILRGEDLTRYLRFVPVNKGDFYYVPAGTIHAIGKDVVLAEVQQSSGITYRVWDWNRVDENGKGRELHVKQALDVLNFEEEKNDKSYFQIQSNIFSNSEKKVFTHRDFDLYSYSLKAGQTLELKSFETKRKSSLINLSGNLIIKAENEFQLPQYCSTINIFNRDLKIEASQDSEFLFVR